MREERRPGKFVWAESGRSYVAAVGKFMITVKAQGRKGAERWRVDDVLGNRYLGKKEHPGVDGAIREAEQLLAQHVKRLSELIETPRRGKA